MIAVQCYPSVTACRISSDESNGHYCSGNSNSELLAYSETEQDEQFDNEVRAIAGKAIQETSQGSRYREHITEFGVHIRRYEDEMPESPEVMPSDSIVPGAVGGNNDTDKYSLQKLPTLQVTNILYFCITNNVLQILITKSFSQ